MNLHGFNLFITVKAQPAFICCFKFCLDHFLSHLQVSSEIKRLLWNNVWKFLTIRNFPCHVWRLKIWKLKIVFNFFAQIGKEPKQIKAKICRTTIVPSSGEVNSVMTTQSTRYDVLSYPSVTKNHLIKKKSTCSNLQK